MTTYRRGWFATEAAEQFASVVQLHHSGSEQESETRYCITLVLPQLVLKRLATAQRCGVRSVLWHLLRQSCKCQ